MYTIHIRVQLSIENVYKSVVIYFTILITKKESIQEKTKRE